MNVVVGGCLCVSGLCQIVDENAHLQPPNRVHTHFLLQNMSRNKSDHDKRNFIAARIPDGDSQMNAQYIIKMHTPIHTMSEKGTEVTIGSAMVSTTLASTIIHQ